MDHVRTNTELNFKKKVCVKSATENIFLLVSLHYKCCKSFTVYSTFILIEVDLAFVLTSTINAIDTRADLVVC